ncbi:hypothetical protein D9615_002909 [Tricholomella constricta]|uniref:MSP domain-containing protein n=1 Tax=Tricholomella constricta TaxID=117010 RepID=A0A8H5M6J0_9AGAR|nr:hypothetical protein D9615_002909 [Tricholomella constricta]
MSVSLNPSSSLGFKRPLTQLVKRSLTITNHNSQPVAFKVKTTAPKLYCVRPNSGRVEPGESIDVSVMLQALREEPPSNAKCKDKFLIQSTLITAEKETMALQDIWTATDKDEEGKVHQQKLRVTYLPAEGQTLEEEEEPHHQPSSFMHPGDHQFDTVRQAPIVNGHQQSMPEFNEPPPPPPPQEAPRPITPPADFSVAREDSREDYTQEVPLVHVTNASEFPPASPAPPVEQQLASDSELEYAPEPAPQPAYVPEPMFMPAPIPVPARIPTPVRETPNAELLDKYEAAQVEIDRLRAILATMEEAPPSEFRRRRPALSDDGSVAETEVATVIDDSHLYHQQEGVPLQVVVIIALGVFITTYLFF